MYEYKYQVLFLSNMLGGCQDLIPPEPDFRLREIQFFPSTETASISHTQIYPPGSPVPTIVESSRNTNIVGYHLVVWERYKEVE